jgi:hypothetical protein
MWKEAVAASFKVLCNNFLGELRETTKVRIVSLRGPEPPEHEARAVKTFGPKTKMKRKDETVNKAAALGLLVNGIQRHAWINRISLSTWSVVLEMLIVAQLVNKFSSPLRNPKFHYHVHKSPPLDLILSRWIQSIPSHPMPCRKILILSTYLRPVLSSSLFSSYIMSDIVMHFGKLLTVIDNSACT